MARLLPTLLVLALLGGAAAAFGVTERLKLTRSPITSTRVPHKVISPVCECDKRVAVVRFAVRREGRVWVSFVDEDGRVVRSLPRRTGSGTMRFEWDGRDAGGAVVPEGSYRPRVRLPDERRTILLPNPIRVDVTPPRIRLVDVRPDRHFSPDGDGRNERVKVRYEVNEPAHGLLLVNGRRELRSRAQRREWGVEWFGRRNGRGLPRGDYRLALAAEDLAGNVSAPGPAFSVTIRYVELARDVVRARAGTRFGVGVLSDARTVRWRFAGRTGTRSAGLLVLRAPRKPGRYTLFVEANRRADRATVVVRARGR